jgi:hypothetical protein
VRIALEDLQRAEISALRRLARALGLNVREPDGATDGQVRRALVFAIARAEKRLEQTEQTSARSDRRSRRR